jgi:uncharacterized protein (TIGR03084 family)
MMPPAPFEELCHDLDEEELALDAAVRGLDDDGWARPTPAQGWDVRDQIGHLALSEELAHMALTDEEAFGRELERLLSDLDRTGTEHLEAVRAVPGPAVLDRWRRSRTSTLQALRSREPEERIPWVGRRMSAMSFATARLMETWAHGQDIIDGLGLARPGTARLRHIAQLGVATRSFSFANRGLDVPNVPVRVELRAPDGELWWWGDESAGDRVRGPAEDFCLVVTQRRPLADTNLVVQGPVATQWMAIAQAFAGPPTNGRQAARSVDTGH